MSETSELPQLQGYELSERIGAGGYGEVWRARAPGGLDKAIKFVFGQHGGTRASHEMKALERIKEVRHPFLLSLERIEVVEGRLLVVTELADGSLRDRYRACVKHGGTGIPRDELLSYLRDAADALDFLSERHQLQHLDVKPENLLLLAEHVKVADFGLVKAIGDQAQSLVGGMTPIYAPPEVFNGRPSRHSDQYSLAILYQELLTGALPFVGTTAAELTLQHLNDEPNLTALGEDDRFVISRALAKDPDNRFDSCRSLIQALTSGTTPTLGEPVPNMAATANRRTAPQLDTSSAADSATVVFDAEDDPQWSSSKAPILIDLPKVDTAQVQAFPQTEDLTSEFQPSPALFIGVGGAAGSVLRLLRQRLNERFGTAGPLATMPMLLLDTDPKSLSAAVQGAGKGSSLTPEETVNLPLRKPQEYREKAPAVLTWLGRRWLYNVPRSMRTEGIRPLGRLALIDHARQTFQRIRRATSEAISTESLETAAQQTGLEFASGKMRVYVVAAIGGGTGSGMTLDVSYAVRAILNRLGIEDATVTGVMMHSTSRESRKGEIARVNAFAWLAEFLHFHRPGVAYPGDQSCGLPAHEAGTPAFDHTYLLDLGAGLDTKSYAAGIESVANYLYADAATPAQAMLDAYRAENPSKPAKANAEEAAKADGSEADKLKAEAEPNRLGMLRSFAIRRNQSASSEVQQVAQAIITEQLLTSLCGGEDEESGSNSTQVEGVSGTNHLVPGAPQLVAQLRLESSGIASMCHALVSAKLGDDPAVCFDAWRASQGDPSAMPFAGLQVPGCRLVAKAPQLTVGGQPIQELIAPLSEKLSEELTKSIVCRVNQPAERLTGADRAANWFRDHLRSVEADLERLEAALRQALATEGETNQGATCQLPSAKVLDSLIDLASVVAAQEVVQTLQAALVSAKARVSLLGKALRESHQLFHQRSANLDRELSIEQQESIDIKAAGMAEELSQLLQAELQNAPGGLFAVSETSTGRAVLLDLLEHLSALITKDALTGVATLSCMQHTPEEAGGEELLTPLLSEFGGSVGHLLMTPREAENSPQDSATKGSVTARVVGPTGEAFLIAEGQDLSVEHVAAHLVNQRRDYAEFAERVHTRQDVAWTKPLEPAPIEDEDPFSMTENLGTQQLGTQRLGTQQLGTQQLKTSQEVCQPTNQLN